MNLWPKATEYFKEFAGFYGRVLTHPLLAANVKVAEYLGGAPTAVGKNIASLYRQAFTQSRAIPLSRLFELDPTRNVKVLEPERV